MPVRFCVVSGIPTSGNIEAVGREVAASDPIGRAVVVAGDPGYPSAADLATWIGGTADAGAVVLKNDGTLYRVLTVAQAQNDNIVDRTMAEATVAGSGQ